MAAAPGARRRPSPPPDTGDTARADRWHRRRQRVLLDANPSARAAGLYPGQGLTTAQARAAALPRRGPRPASRRTLASLPRGVGLSLQLAGQPGRRGRDRARSRGQPRPVRPVAAFRAAPARGSGRARLPPPHRAGADAAAARVCWPRRATAWRSPTPRHAAARWRSVPVARAALAGRTPSPPRRHGLCAPAPGAGACRAPGCARRLRRRPAGAPGPPDRRRAGSAGVLPAAGSFRANASNSTTKSSHHPALLFPLRRLIDDLAPTWPAATAACSASCCGSNTRISRTPRSRSACSPPSAIRRCCSSWPARGSSAPRSRRRCAALRLLARELPPFVPAGRDLFDDRPAAGDALGALRERLRARLGDDAVYRWRRRPIRAPSGVATHPVAKTRTGAARCCPPRPTWLLPQPVPLRDPQLRILSRPRTHRNRLVGRRRRAPRLLRAAKPRRASAPGRSVAAGVDRRRLDAARLVRMSADAAAAYAELHCLSIFTFRRGASSAEELFDACEGRSATARWRSPTNARWPASCARSRRRARRGLKLIVGSELTLDDGLKLVLLVETHAGYSALCRLITLGRRRRRERARTSSHARTWRAGLPDTLALWVPGATPVPAAGRMAARHVPASARWLAVELHRGADDEARLRALLALADTLGLPAVASGDVHMARARPPRVAGHADRDPPRTARWPMPARTCSRTANATCARGGRWRTSIRRDCSAESAAHRAALHFDLRSARLPLSARAGAGGAHAHLAAARAGRTPACACAGPGACDAKVRAQIDNELALIAELEYEAFFLTVHDIVRFAREQRHPVPGPRLGGQFGGVFCAGHHRGRSGAAAACCSSASCRRNATSRRTSTSTSSTSGARKCCSTSTASTAANAPRWPRR